MTYHELVKKVQTAIAKADASKIEEHIAVQVNVTGEAEGAFYIEIAGGVPYVAPYDYNDRDALLTIAGDDILAVAEGKLDMMKAFEAGKVQIEAGDEGIAKLLMLASVIPTKKAAAKKEAEKPAPAAEAAPAEETAPAAEEASDEEKPKRGRKCKTECKTETASAEKKTATKKATVKKNSKKSDK